MIEQPSSNHSAAPVLSVGLPVYNGEKWIAEAIDSILVQNVEDLELIISDNASTDRTESICRAVAARDSRVRYYRNNTNIGLYRNFDRVFELATGKYFKWAADSDICLEGFFEKCVAVLDARDDVVLAYPRTLLLLWGPDGEEVVSEYINNLNIEDDRPSDRFRKYLDRERINNVMHGVIRASALRKTSLIRPLPGSDISMIAELSLLGKFIEIPEPLFARRFDPETSSMLMNTSTASTRKVPLGRTFMQRLDLHAYRFLSTFRAPIDFSEKLKVWLYLLNRATSIRHQVYNKLMRLLMFRKK
ncbi:MAG: glycosyltransferase family 2 protein [Chromatiaceae bacterium]|nr:glycosyltransferase family 2 protein [Chromatiaceae bacterium]MCP5443954.1 glycosyltransferase family 2 protein [Chromatiaceae bacterium]